MRRLVDVEALNKMKYIKELNGEFFLSEYQEYIKTRISEFPKGAQSFLAASSYFDFDDEKCPHDAWIENINITEQKLQDCSREVNIYLKILGNKHNGFIHIDYLNVTSYLCDFFGDKSVTKKWHGDWIVDEMLILPNGKLQHEIYLRAARLLIVFHDIHYNWKIKANI